MVQRRGGSRIRLVVVSIYIQLCTICIRQAQGYVQGGLRMTVPILRTAGDLKKSGSSRREQPVFVILPGFGTASLDYINPNGRGVEKGLAAGLAKRGVTSYVVPVQKGDWFKVAAGLLEPNFWKKKMLPDGRAYGWYLQKVRETVQEARKVEHVDKVVLCGHSAGGWLARAVLGTGTFDTQTGLQSGDAISCLVTLGAPHFPGPTDMTFGALTYTSDAYPGAFLAPSGIKYVTVAGEAIRGQKIAGLPRKDPALRAYNSYQFVCGEGELFGDGVVPVKSAHLSGALQITLPGVTHDITSLETWYGADAAIDRWLPQTLRLINKNSTPSKTTDSGTSDWFSQLFGSQKSIK